jgi:hypothetical protein
MIFQTEAALQQIEQAVGLQTLAKPQRRTVRTDCWSTCWQKRRNSLLGGRQMTCGKCQLLKM